MDCIENSLFLLELAIEFSSAITLELFYPNVDNKKNLSHSENNFTQKLIRKAHVW